MVFIKQDASDTPRFGGEVAIDNGEHVALDDGFVVLASTHRHPDLAGDVVVVDHGALSESAVGEIQPDEHTMKAGIQNPQRADVADLQGIETSDLRSEEAIEFAPINGDIPEVPRTLRIKPYSVRAKTQGVREGTSTRQFRALKLLWSVPGLVESAHVTQGCVGLVAMDGFVFDWGVHSKARVTSLSVVEDLKVLEDRVGEFDTGAPSFPVQQFDLHPGPE